jgi:hypothetical protein
MEKLARFFGWPRPRLQRIIEALDRPATSRFIALAFAVVWFGTFALARHDYRSFLSICNQDPGAVLRVDEIITQGFRPGSDFFYYYGLLPLGISHAFFSVVGRAPGSLLVLLFMLSCLLYVGVTWAIAAFHPTRLGTLLLAIAAGHVTDHASPTHAMEAACLMWAVALRFRGHSAGAIALATVGLFTKMSMASVLLCGLVGLRILDALRTRRFHPLTALLTFPIVFGIGAALCVAWLGVPAFANTFDARAGAAIYKAWNLGFLREGRGFWHPAGHNLNWYLGSVAGPWCVGSIVLVFLAIRSVFRLLRATIRRETHNSSLVAEEAHALAGFGHIAFVVGFYGASLSVYHYAWLLLIGLAPIIGRARLGVSHHERKSLPQPLRGLGWLSLGVVLLLSQTNALKGFVAFEHARRVTVGHVTMAAAQAEELNAALALGHSVGSGVITAIGLAANFGLVDPTIREGHYWVLGPGVPWTKALDETMQLAKSSDTIFVTKRDYPHLCLVSEVKPLLEKSERLHDGKHFLLLRSPKRAQEL